MNPYFLEMEARDRYKDFLRDADMHRLIKRLKAQRRARRIAMWRDFTLLIRSFVVAGRKFKPQA
jgi:hypothetical protein